MTKKRLNFLVRIEDNDLVVGTWDLSNGFKTTHQSLKKLILKYKERFERVGNRQIKGQILVVFPDLKSGNSNPKKGRPETEFIINEEQAAFLGTLLKNNDIVLTFKEKLVKEFFRMRKTLVKLMVQQQNTEWHQKRAEGKIVRRFETDAIKLFVEYAKEQGSKSADKYYMIITKMENTTLFNLEFIEHKYDNLRNMLNGFSLNALQVADHIVGKALKEGMEKRLYYKDIYQLAKARIETFAESMGKIVPQLEFTETRTIGKHV